jgi:anthranilate synthase/aminodeoxychorismate synthase-like glutamine amidotransferase
VIIIIDNYDSFVFNLAQYIGEFGGEPRVYRNDCITVDEIAALAPSHVIISPGPCTPLEAGVSNAVIRELGGKIPILGVCLGHQCIGYVYGAEVVHAPLPTHGKSALIHHDGKTIYQDLPNPFEGGRYHSLVVRWDQPLADLEAAAHTQDGVIMGIRHKRFAVEGVQFHPESIMTDVGHALLANFLKITLPIRSE